ASRRPPWCSAYTVGYPPRSPAKPPSTAFGPGPEPGIGGFAGGGGGIGVAPRPAAASRGSGAPPTTAAPGAGGTPAAAAAGVPAALAGGWPAPPRPRPPPARVDGASVLARVIVVSAPEHAMDGFCAGAPVSSRRSQKMRDRS